MREIRHNKLRNTGKLHILNLQTMLELTKNVANF